MCNKKEYIDPFSHVSKMYTQKLDDAIIAEDYEKLEKLLCEIELTLPNIDAASQARLYYAIGTVYGDFAEAKGLSYEESVKKQLYCFLAIINLQLWMNFMNMYLTRIMTVFLWSN